MAEATVTHGAAYDETTPLYMALELSAKEWRLGFSVKGDRIAERKVRPGDADGLSSRIERAKKQFGLASSAPVRSCYEAGRDGFWVDRFLRQLGIENLVVDAASMKVNRRARRAKSDGIDVWSLLVDLVRHDRGDQEVWKVVRVPSTEAEDERRLHRELHRLKKERSQHRVRIKSLLALHGVRVQSLGRFLRHLEEWRIWDGSRLPAGLRGEIARERDRLQLVEEQIRGVQKQQRVQLKEEKLSPALEKVQRLESLCGIGLHSAWLLVMELFGWREFANRRELGGSVGLGGTPYDSGSKVREQGISKAGNPLVRQRMVELAWLWIRLQPQSDLTLWFRRRCSDGSRRMRRVAIVAVARRLLIELWHFVEHGVTPSGALLKPIKSSSR